MINKFDRAIEEANGVVVHLHIYKNGCSRNLSRTLGIFSGMNEAETFGISLQLGNAD